MSSSESDGVPPIPPAPVAPPPAPYVAPAGAVTPPEPPPVVGPAAAAPNPYAPAPPTPQSYAATPPPSAPQYGAQPAYSPVATGPAQGLSIASMVCGIAGLLLALFGLGFLVSVAAVITGHIAQRKQPYARPFWLTGIITGYVGVGIGAITIIFFVAIFFAALSAGLD